MIANNGMLISKFTESTYRSIWTVSEREAIADKAQRLDCPSTEAQNKHFMSRQNPLKLEAMWCSRPLTLIPPSVAIFEPEFARFVENVNKPADSFDFSQEEIAAAKKFVQVSSALFANEADRQSDLSSVDFFDMLSYWVSSKIRVERGDMEPDGHLAFKLRNHWFKLPIYISLNELKNGIGEGKCDPSIQALLYWWGIVTSNKVRMSHLRRNCCR